MRICGCRFILEATLFWPLIALTSFLSLVCRKEPAIPEITVNIDVCAHCNMVVSDVRQACGYFTGNEFIPFDSPGCLLNEFEKHKKGDGVVPTRIYFGDYCSSGFVPVDSTYFLITDHIPTVMDAGVLCFAIKDSAQTYKKFHDEKITDWLGYQVSKGIPARIVRTTITPAGMNPEVIVLNKNEVVEWVFQGERLQSDVALYLKGYEELGVTIVPASGEPVKLRMLSDKPGAGFPFVRGEGGIPIGMVKVVGAHTSDEEAM